MFSKGEKDSNYYISYKTISLVLLSLTILFIIFLSSTFFLGSEHDHIALKRELIKNMTTRMFAFASLGFPIIIVVAFIESIGIDKNNKAYILLAKKIVLMTLIVLISSLFGSSIFFLL